MTMDSYIDIYRQRADLRAQIRKIQKEVAKLKKRERELTEKLQKDHFEKCEIPVFQVLKPLF